MQIFKALKTIGNLTTTFCQSCKYVLITITLLLILSSTSIAQKEKSISIKGKVVSRETGLPLELVNVFLSNTTIGTTTGKDGKFLINNVPPGTYVIVFSYVGFEPQRRNFQTYNQEALNYYISLVPKPINIRPVEIVGDVPEDWEDNLELFENVFIGESDNAKKTRILNPEVINFTELKNPDILKATADSVLIIENKTLGYMIDVTLESFNYDRSTNGIRYKNYSKFQELTPQSEDEKKEWKENRRKTYLNSPRYFFYQLVHRQLYKNNYVLYTGAFNELRYQDGKEIDEDYLDLTTDKDSINYTLNFSGNLKIVDRRNKETSILTFYNPTTQIDKLGNYLKPFYTLEIYGYWSKQGIADALPINYDYTNK